MVHEMGHTGLLEFFQSKYGLVVHFARRMAPDPSLVPDIVQQVYLEFLKDAQRKNWVLHEEGNPLLYRVTKNVVRKIWRNHQKESHESIRRIGEFLKERIDSQYRSDDDVMEEEKSNQIESLHACLDQLSPKHRRLIDMKYFLDTPTSDIAEIFHAKPHNINRVIARIRLQLAKCLEKKST